MKLFFALVVALACVSCVPHRGRAVVHPTQGPNDTVSTAYFATVWRGNDSLGTDDRLLEIVACQGLECRRAYSNGRATTASAASSGCQIASAGTTTLVSRSDLGISERSWDLLEDCDAASVAYVVADGGSIERVEVPSDSMQRACVAAALGGVVTPRGRAGDVVTCVMPR